MASHAKKRTTGKKTPNHRRTAGFLFAAVAIACVLIAGFFSVNNLIFQLTANQAAGQVVALETARTPEGQVRVPVEYQAVIEFPDRNGQFRRFTDGSTTGEPPAIGSDVTVLYNPKKPSQAKMANYLLIWRAAINAGVGALIAGILAEELLRGSR